MEQKSWVRKYGIHIAICAVIAAGAFGINQKIETERNRQYTVSEPIPTLLKEVTGAETEGGIFRFSGWCFDTFFYNGESNCELILQDVETGEALWPKMEEKPDSVQIAERYADGGDYSGAGFQGSIKSGRLAEDKVYEVLLRYTSDYIDEAGMEQKYVRTVTADKFIYRGEMADYNPKTFAVPEIAGTELEKELEGARLFHYFPEGMWIYYDEEKLYYIMEESLIGEQGDSWCYLHWMVRNIQNLPEDRKQYGFGNSDFRINSENTAYEGIERYKIAIVDLESPYITHIETGLYYAGIGKIFGREKQLEYGGLLLKIQ